MSSQRVQTRRAEWVAAGLLAVFVLLAGTSALQHSAVYHERLYIYAGVQNLRHGVYELGAGTPSGLLQLAALPLQLMDLDDHAGPPIPPDSYNSLGVRFLYQNRVPASQILMAARAPFLALGVALGLMIFVWARRLYGDAGGLLALGLYVLSPAMLAHSQFTNQSFGVAALSLMALYTLWRLCERATGWRVLVAGLVMGGAQLTKFTATALLPVSLILVLWKSWTQRASERRPRLAPRLLALATVWAIAGLVVWADYRFEVGAVADAQDQLVVAHGPFHTDSVCPIAAGLGAWVVPAPHYWCGLSSQLLHGTIGHENYLAGEYSSQGWWYYYLITLLYKVPVPVLIFFAVRVVTALRERLNGVRASEAPFLLLFPGLILLVFSMSATQLGERYILAVYPPLFVWLGGLASSGLRAPWTRVAGGLLCGWLLLGTLWIHPHHLMYFNEIAGGPTRGWKTIVAGYDLGQDVGNLERYVRDRDISSIAVACQGCEWRGVLELPQQPLPCRPTTGYVAVSVYKRLERCFTWLDAHEPIDHVGYSILIYRIP